MVGTKSMSGGYSRKDRERRERVRKMLRVLKRLFPDAHIALQYHTPWELVVAVVLSAQCTDKKVNEVTRRLFKKYRTVDDYARAPLAEFARDIRATGFYRNKAKNIIAAARLVRDRFHGRVPCSMDELLTLPGVARKTANVILWNACGKIEGIAVDTHVKRFVQRFRLSDYTDPVRIERDLMRVVPRRQWPFFTYALIEYGRQVCPARKHECTMHPLTRIYPPAAYIWPRARQ